MDEHNNQKNNTEIEIIFEHPDYLVINKPANLMAHSDGRSDEKTLCDFIVEKYPEIEGVGEPLIIKTKNENGEIVETQIDRPGIVHRLDKDTSGIMLIARTQKGFEYLKEQFQDRNVEKTYHAFVYDNIKEDEFEINVSIGRDKNDFRRWKAGDSARGQLRPAQTFFKVLERSENKKVTFIEARPKTGRTHQIRVHLKHIYKPIVSDSLYAPDRESLLGFERQALHAREIEFTDLAGQNVTYTAEYPNDFEQALATLV
jgi:23S rRNA pseudouridine1911/1915/1917 synthase